MIIFNFIFLTEGFLDIVHGLEFTVFLIWAYTLPTYTVCTLRESFAALAFTQFSGQILQELPTINRHRFHSFQKCFLRKSTSKASLHTVCSIQIQLTEIMTDRQNSGDFFSKGGGLFVRVGDMVSHGDSTVKWAKIIAWSSILQINQSETDVIVRSYIAKNQR